MRTSQVRLLLSFLLIFLLYTTGSAEMISPAMAASCPMGTAPTVTAFAIQTSCNTDNTINSDGFLQISSLEDGDRFNWSIGSTYSGDTDYANATDTMGLGMPLQVTTGLSNPVGSQDYTIRVFNGASNCFTDVVVTLVEQDCVIGCNCNEYVYLNEPSTDGAVLKFRINADSSFTQIGSPWFDNGVEMEGVTQPHGLIVDENGFVYVGETASGDQIRKFTCDGQIFPESDFAISNGGQTNMATREGRFLYANDWVSDTWNKYEISSQNLVSSLTTCQGTIRNWGLHYDISRDTFFATSSFGTNEGSFLYSFSDADFDNDPATCINGYAIPYANNHRVGGVTTDADGFVYIVIQDNGAADGSYIAKHDKYPPYAQLATSAIDLMEDGDGYNKALGIIYDETTNLLFVSSTSSIEDCVSTFDTDLNVLPESVGPAGNGDNGKGIATVSECCPSSNNMTIDTLLCNIAINEQVSLFEITECNGILCEGVWEQVTVNSGMTYDPIENAITINSTGACGTFLLESDGVGLKQCGAFRITVNICAGCYDFGDLPDLTALTGPGDYQTDSTFMGPGHIIIDGLSIGSIVDGETNGQSSANADGDMEDEDGFNFSSNLNFVPGGTINIPIDVTNTTGIVAHFEIWVDWNNDGDFSPGEQVANLSDDGMGDFGISSFPLNIPTNAVVDQPLGFRARLSHTDNMMPLGIVSTGEVEDYQITVSCNPSICLPIGFTKN